MGSNIAELLRLMFLLSVPALKSAELREGGLANVGIQIRLIVPLHPHIYSPLWLPVIPLEVQLVFHMWIRVGVPLRQAKAGAQKYLYQQRHLHPMLCMGQLRAVES